MNQRAPTPISFSRAALWLLAASLTASVADLHAAQSDQHDAPVVLDRVVAVVNKHAILASDINDEIRLSVLDPNLVGQGVLTRQGALEQLISRALIEQQIREQDMQAIEPSQDEVNARLDQIRKQLPACVHEDCATDAGWKAFLLAHGLTPERVESYLRYRLEILSFIEERFRQGIQISPQQIDSYYNDTLLPQYAAGETVPPLDQVAPRIQEILLERQVNVLFDAWLTNLRGQGDVEVLDPSLEDPALKSAPTQDSGPALNPVSNSGASR
jgi:peptidyl-prolyl cis-trans isomerase SurA